MKNAIIIFLSLALITFLTFWYSTKDSDDLNQVVTTTTSASSENIDEKITASNCLADECLEVEDLEYPAGTLPKEVQQALEETIIDEYKAEATYKQVIADFGNIRPFSMIKQAETSHINSLKNIYDKYDLDYPKNTHDGNIQSFESITEACQTSVEAEVANVAIYDKLFKAVKDYEDITIVFTQLRNASQNQHLPAFQKCAN